MKNKSKNIQKFISCLMCLLILFLGAVNGIDSFVKLISQNRIITSDQAASLENVDCILVLGCLVKDDGKPSDMLADRLTRGIELYNLNAAPKLLMSGDHGRQNYDEVYAMKSFAVNSGIASEHVFMDHAGFSTYESIYRAKEIFQAKKIVIVSQEYHLYRAIYIAQMLGMEAYGVSSDYHIYYGQSARDFREVLARIKDFGTTIFRPKPTYLGEVIPISGDGNLTNDENSDFV